MMRVSFGSTCFENGNEDVTVVAWVEGMLVVEMCSIFDPNLIEKVTF